MLNFESPGVYIQEVDSGAKPIEIAGTSTAAFLGYARTGDTMVPVPLESYRQFVEQFGGISETGEKDHDPMSFGVRAFFQNGGRRAYVVNVASGGESTTAAMTAGRQNPVALFTLNSKHPGTRYQGVDVYLTPKDGPGTGLFDLEIVEDRDTGPTVVESHPGVTLAPGLPNSVEGVVNNGASSFEITIDAGLDARVFPETGDIARSDLRGAGDLLNLKVAGGTARQLKVDWPAADTAVGDVTALNDALADFPMPAGIRVEARSNGATNVILRVLSDVESATITVLDDATVIDQTAKSRGDKMRELVTGTDGASLNQAVLSGEFVYDPTRLSEHYLDLRLGLNFARRVDFARLGPRTTAKGFARWTEDQLKAGYPASLQSLSITTTSENQCVIEFGSDAPAGATLTEQTASPLFVQSGPKLKSPKFVSVPASMEVQYKDEAGNWTDADPDKTVTLDPGEPLSALEAKLDALVKAGTNKKLFDIALQGYEITLEAKHADMPVRVHGVGARSLAALLNLGENTDLTNGAPVTSRIATPEELKTIAPLSLKLEEADAAAHLTVDVDINGANLVSATALRNEMQSELMAWTDPAAVDVHVELIKDRLLIWDATQGVSILGFETDATAGTGAAQLRLTDRTGGRQEPLDDLQQSLAITGELGGGEPASPGGLSHYRAALAELEAVPDVSIICLPGHPWDKGEGTSYQMVEAAIRHAERQQDRMVIVDPPKPDGNRHKWRDRNSIRLADLPTSSYAAIYYPWARVHVPAAAPGTAVKPKEVPVAPSGFAAGVWSWMDQERGVWRAPAGVDARVYGVSRFEHELTDAEGGALNQEGVNALRSLRGWGSIVWGARTAATRSEPQWRYLPVRRTAILIEDSLREALAWAVHQPNRPTLWASLRLNIEVFLNRLFQAGAFQADNPRDAYFVECGLNSTMSPADIDAGVVRVRIGIAPSKPAEFVVITIEQINEQG